MKDHVKKNFLAYLILAALLTTCLMYAAAHSTNEAPLPSPPAGEVVAPEGWNTHGT